MSSRFFRIPVNNEIHHCPKCGQNTSFTAKSDYCAEDCCEVWVECKCGFDPTAEHGLYRFEDAMGGCTKENIRMALSCWNDVVDAEYSGIKKCPHGIPFDGPQCNDCSW